MSRKMVGEHCYMNHKEYDTYTHDLEVLILERALLPSHF